MLPQPQVLEPKKVLALLRELCKFLKGSPNDAQDIKERFIAIYLVSPTHPLEPNEEIKRELLKLADTSCPQTRKLLPEEGENLMAIIERFFPPPTP